jgi:hypothetical protein
MYLDFYGLRDKPFNLTPDPRFVFLSKPRQEAFAHLLYGINNRAGVLALLARGEESFLLDLPIGGRKSLPPGEVEKYWFGQGFLLWKDALKLPTWIGPGSRGSHVRRLQSLLQEAGTPGAPSNGVYDRDTLAAAKESQLVKGIGRDGIVGSQTLMLLYGSVDRFGAPRLAAGQE